MLRARTTPPKRAELLAALDSVELGLSALMRRWQEGLTPELRVEIMDLYQPVLRILILARRR